MNTNVSFDDTGLIISVTPGNFSKILVISYHWPALLLVSFSLIGILGNVLVCLAIGTERRLQNRTNWFLFSLAFADMLVSGLVIPLAIVKEFAGRKGDQRVRGTVFRLGFWILGPVVCDLWIFFDVCSCTSSIMHIVVISIDRYLAIHDPLNVRSRQENSQILLLIFLIWLIAIFLSSPMIVLGLINPYNVFINGQCLINNEFFVIYGSVVSFVIPLIIVIVMYVLTVHRLKEQIRQCQQQFAREQIVSTASLVARPFISHATLNTTSSSRSILLSGTKARGKQTSFELSEVSLDNLSMQKEASFIPPDQCPTSKISPHAEYACPKNPFCQLKCTCPHPTLEPVQEGQSASPPRVTFRPNPSRTPRPLSLPSSVQFRSKQRQPLIPSLTATRTKSSAVRNERKAVKVLGVVFVIFVIAWFPFCIMNLLQGVCKRCSIDPTLLNSFVWLGYVSSSINPLVYTIFNRNFRVKFLALLHCQCFYRSARQRQLSYYHSQTSLNGGSRLQRMNALTANDIRQWNVSRRPRSETVSS